MVTPLLEALRADLDHEAIVCAGECCTSRWLLDRVIAWDARFREDALAPGSIVGVPGDFSPDAVSLFLALVRHSCVIVPTGQGAAAPERLRIAQVEYLYDPATGPRATGRPRVRTSDHELYVQLREAGHAGLVLFSSGTTGEPKAALHDLDRLAAPAHRRRSYRAVAFLLFDHIGGINTMLRVLTGRGTLIVPDDRSPDGVLGAVARHRAELLPTSPSFLNLAIVSGAITRHDLDSLELITYGTEPMPEVTLRRLRELVPHVDLRQTYGLSEVGILASSSRDSSSVWVKVGGPGFETRVVDGILQVRAESAMLGYLNAPSPFTADGWLSTGDRVEVDGEFVRILGRDGETVNVGGQKVDPLVVENVLLEVDGVGEVTVDGERNPLLGSIVRARIRPTGAVDPATLVRTAKRHCRERLQRHEVPVRIEVVYEPQHNDRYKKLRRQRAAS